MDSSMKPTPTEAYPETMDFLSSAWCNFAVQALQPDAQDQSIILLDNSINKFNSDMKAPLSVSGILRIAILQSFVYFDLLEQK